MRRREVLREIADLPAHRREEGHRDRDAVADLRTVPRWPVRAAWTFLIGPTQAGSAAVALNP